METTDLQIKQPTSTWRKFCRNKLALAGLIFIALVTLITILGYCILPDDSPFANRQNLEIAAKKPGFSVTFLKKPLSDIPKVHFVSYIIFGQPQQFEYIPIDTFFFKNHTLYGRIYSDVHDNSLIQEYPFEAFIKNKNIEEKQAIEIIKKENISKSTFILGTDRFGRDLLSRMVIGARVSMSVGLIAVLISLVIGMAAGSIAGYFRGRIDAAIMWLVNVTWSVPTLLMVISITMVLGKGFWQVFIAVGLTMWVDVARIMRGQVMGLREKDFIEACRAMGFSNFRIITKHIIPNTLGPIFIISAANFASAILIESGLSFLGVGVQPPIPSWGSMIKDHYGYIILNKAYLAILPGMAIMLLTLAFTFVGNGLRDAFDSKTIQIS